MSKTLPEYPDIRVPHLQGFYFSYIRNYLAKHGLSLQINRIDTATLPRENDECIMDLVCRDSTFSTADIQKVYYCKSYLEFKWVSDMCTADGEQVHVGVVYGEKSIRHSASMKEEIVQERPSEASWIVWRKFLLKHVCYNRKWDIKLELGNWLVHWNESDRLWPFYYASQSDSLYKSYRQQWHSHDEYQYERYEGHASDPVYSFEPIQNSFHTDEESEIKVLEKVLTLPDDAVPCDVTDSSGKGWGIVPHYCITSKAQANIESPENFENFIRQQPEFISQYYSHIEFYHSKFHLFDQIDEDNTILIASDGGAIPNQALIGFVIADDQGNIFVTCWGQPSRYDPQSFRSKVCSTLAALRLIKFYCEYFRTITGETKCIKNKFEIITDSESMQKKIANMDKYPSAPVKMILHPDWDVLSALYRELQWYPNRPTMTWIASHQDDNKKTVKLGLEAQLNVHADELATMELHRLGPKLHVPLNLDSKVQLNYQGMTITRNLKKTVRELIQLRDLKAYYCRRFEWTSDTKQNRR